MINMIEIGRAFALKHWIIGWSDVCRYRRNELDLQSAQKDRTIQSLSSFAGEKDKVARQATDQMSLNHLSIILGFGEKRNKGKFITMIYDCCWNLKQKDSWPLVIHFC